MSILWAFAPVVVLSIALWIVQRKVRRRAPGRALRAGNIARWRELKGFDK